MIKIFDRSTEKIYYEKQYKSKQLEFLYNTYIGRILLKIFITKRVFSRVSAIFNNSKGSIKKIEPFIKEYEIDMKDYPKVEYTSFNDFFTRKIIQARRKFSKINKDLISVADAKLLVYKIDNDLKMNIKNSIYTCSELLKGDELSEKYKNGTCLVFRLTVDDYHRYCFIDEGIIKGNRVIHGRLHTVGPISAKRYKVYSENHREYSILDTKNFDEVVQIEVGALLVGKIKNHSIKNFKRGQEKGYFCFGGSTIVLLFKENIVKIDEDILNYSKEGIETKVKMGEKIGEAND
ncbi:phosphatidylserine decarboxylase [Clostridium felsineum]|uniref:phosphatidylserine decarboxylase n=1 Tax=Clostridium felsineum TaxID=36839 RepID=UPI00098CD624|nr:phosphatidylserine decarboxylase [Clostridium felsineum]URZ17448.1 Phosphatidylserine decarboxylase proenzyme [Clostridium felsineum DSM 794]